MFASPGDFLPKPRRDSSKRMARVYEQDPRSESLTALPTVPPNLPVSEESSRGYLSTRRSPKALLPFPPLHSPGLSSSCSNSPTFYSPITPDTSEPAIPSPGVHIASANDSPMQRYPRAHPSIPSLRTSEREKAIIGAIHRATTTFDLPATFNLSLPYLAPHSSLVNRSSSKTATSQLSRAGSRKECRYGLDFQQAGLAHKNITNDAPTDRHRDSFLPSIHTGDEDAHMDESATHTPSSASSSSLCMSEFDFEFPQPPLSPDLGAYKNCPMFTEEETCQVKKILRKRWGAIDVIEQSPPIAPAASKTRTPSSSVPSSLPASMDGEESTTNLSWTKCWDGKAFGDFSWEAYDGSGNTGDNENEGTHKILEDFGLSDNVEDTGRTVSSGQTNGATPVLGLPGSLLNVRRPVEEDPDDVSAVLTALRSSILLDYLAEQDKCTDDDMDSDQTLCEELRIRMGTKKCPPVAQIQEGPVVPVSNPVIVARCLQPRNLSSNSAALPSPKTSALKPLATLPTPKPSGRFGEARIVSRYIPGAKNMTDAHSSRTSAFERLETSISRLQMHSPHPSQQSRSYAPPVPPKDNLGIYSRNFSRSSDVVKKKPTVISPPMGRFAPELQVKPSTSDVHAGSKNNCRDKHLHVRSPSAPASVMDIAVKPRLALAFSVHEKRPDALHNERSRRNVLPSLSPDKINAEGFRSFMDMTPEQKPRQTQIRSRSSMASAAFHAEKARKLLARASSSIASWGKGLGWSSSRKD